MHLSLSGGAVIFSTKRVGETAPAVFDFTSAMLSDETILGSSFTCTVYSGTDANPSVMVTGPGAVAGKTVRVNVTGGVSGVIYTITCTINTSGARTLQQTGQLAVTPRL